MIEIVMIAFSFQIAIVMIVFSFQIASAFKKAGAEDARKYIGTAWGVYAFCAVISYAIGRLPVALVLVPLSYIISLATLSAGKKRGAFLITEKNNQPSLTVPNPVQSGMGANIASSAPYEKRSTSPEIIFLRDDKSTSDSGEEITWHIFRAAGENIAINFLRTTGIADKNQYFIVETPEGNYGKGVTGVYKE